MKSRTPNVSLVIGIVLLLFLIGIVLSASILFLLGVSISTASFWVAVCASIVCLLAMTYTFFTTRRTTMFLSLLMGLGLVFGVSWYVSTATYDLSWDGQTYHQEAIILLKNGWNPVHDQPLLTITDTQKFDNPSEESLRTPFYLWINHYTKGPWILDAVMYKLTDNIEGSKMFNFILLFASFFLCLAAILNAYPEKKRRAVFFSLLLACNPVVIAQLVTFYIDGQLASLVLIICSLGYLLFKRFNAWIVVGLCSAIILLTAIKFTALVYAVLLCGGLLVLFFLYDKHRHWKKLLLSLVACGLVAVTIVGYNPYVTNFLAKGHPFYPLAGEHAVDIMTANSPADFKGKNPFEKFFVSLFAKSENITRPNESTMKWPFTIAFEEFQAFVGADARVAGFGPLFGGAVLVTCVVSLALFLRNRQLAKPVFLLSGIILLTVFINPESWWARYVPQLWFVPILIAMVGFESEKQFVKYGSWLLICTLSINLLLVGATQAIAQSFLNVQVNIQLHEMKKSKLPVLVDFQHFHSNRIRLEKAEIEFIEAKIDDKNAKKLSSSRATYLLR
ncbi:hypothetical protein EGH10_19355 [Brevibacillus laterosporus]|uniref:Glycosyltransferase RgtA/B/C/D-like domain-containing protein n=1 Tax=Brevibacillus laterosporus LMG 15441 TaxID=1042163 RepID=A0A075R5C2_BRELA|nr:hypothetical protein [Brevibacillus laterosporus]AIG27752.1 hypothetical protein BRLA_c034400 [Brevibacillus laterosporus LMG 15441]RJL15637.1 hypothetical protein DM460_01760 [Brevibacillus laterosporus]TPH06199.1 hypothetical protein EGH10_19355 [Brevibacillus laterosporus]